MYRALNKLFRNRAILGQIAEMIIKDSLAYLPDPAIKKITDKLIGEAASLGSRQSMQLAITGYLGSKVVGGMMASVIMKLSLRLWTGTLSGGIVLQGVLSRASAASRRLRLKNPELWSKLYILDFEMLYFLFEEPLANYIELGETLRKNPSKTEQFLGAIENL